MVCHGAAALAATVTALGCCGSAGAEAVGPGHRDYWVELARVVPSRGHLQPPWSPDVGSYDLDLDDWELRRLCFHIDLERDKYEADGFPDVYVNSKKQEYRPADAFVKVCIPLNGTLGPFATTVQIEVTDPKATGGFLGIGSYFRQKKYEIHVTQPPDFTMASQANGFEVRDELGMPLHSLERFSPKVKKYTYIVASDAKRVSIKPHCSKFATSIRVNGEELAQGVSYKAQLLATTTRVHVECLYFDKQLLVSTEQVYSLAMVRAGTQPRVLDLSLVISAEQGYCTLREDRDAAADVTKESFLCRTDVLEPEFMVMYTDRLSTTLEDKGANKTYQLRPGVPVAVSVNEKQLAFDLRIQGGGAEVVYPVHVVLAAPCSTLKCPMHFFPRPRLATALSGQARLCFGESCDPLRDTEHCCDKVASCETFEECPGNKVLRSDAKDLHCHDAMCDEEDASICCVAAETCDKYKCPSTHVPRPGRASRSCRREQCDEEDLDFCCVERTTCATFKGECWKGFRLRPDPLLHICKGAVCSTAECCEESLATCADLPRSCPNGRKLGKDAKFVNCEGKVCSDADVKHCCGITDIEWEAQEERRQQEGRLEMQQRWAERQQRLEQQAVRSRLNMELQRAKDAQVQREAYYSTVGCSPIPKRSCEGKMCYFEEACTSTSGETTLPGCFAADLDPRCRFCGFGGYDECPRTPLCEQVACTAWSTETRIWCYEKFNIVCLKDLTPAKSLEQKYKLDVGQGQQPRSFIPTIPSMPVAAGGVLAIFSLLSFGYAALRMRSWARLISRPDDSFTPMLPIDTAEGFVR